LTVRVIHKILCLLNQHNGDDAPQDCYSNFLLIGFGELPYIFFTDECAVHPSDRHCHVLLGTKNTRTSHCSWNTFRHTVCCVKELLHTKGLDRVF